MNTLVKNKKHQASNLNLNGSDVILSKQSFQEVINTAKGTVFRRTDCERAWLPGPDGKGISFSRIIQTAIKYPAPSNSSAITYSEPKSTRRGKKAKGSKSKSRSSSSSNSMYVVLKILMWASITGAVLLYFSQFNSPNRENLFWSTSNIASLLEKSLFGQDVAIVKLVDALDITLKTQSPTVLILTGSVGVGKTLATTVLKKTFPWPGNLYSYNEREFSVSHLVHTLRREPPWTMVVIDDCCKDPQITMSLVTSLLNRAEREEAKLLVVVAYTHRTAEELQAFFSSFERSALNHVQIPFALLDRDAVRMCFLRELEKNGLPRIDELVEEIVDYQMEFIPEVRATPGCKLIDSKVTQYRELIGHRPDEF